MRTDIHTTVYCNDEKEFKFMVSGHTDKTLSIHSYDLPVTLMMSIEQAKDLIELLEREMDRGQYDKQLIKWVKEHYWDSLEKDKDLILRHLRTFAGDVDLKDDIEVSEIKGE